MNKLIKGDSLEVLKTLDDNSVDLIYIDPPYLFYTSKKGAFNYNSDFTLGQWRELLVPRLTEARRVLKDTGILFASINEYGQVYLQLFLQEVFGYNNFVENFIWNNPNTGKNNSLTTRTSHEYVLCYAKNKASISNQTYFRKKKRGADEVQAIFASMKALGKTNEQIELALKAFYKNKDLDVCNFCNVDDVGVYKGGDISAPSSRRKDLDVYNFCNVDDVGVYKGENISAPSSKNKKTYDVLHPVTRQPCKLPSKGWGFIQESMQELLDQDRISFGEDHTTVPRVKSYLYAPVYNVDRRYTVLTSLIEDTSYGKKDLLDLFDEAPFVFPKPVSLIKTLVSMHPSKDIKVLDFFAGSGTTGHAVMELNKEDGGSRSFILVEQMDYAEDLTKERIIRAMSKYEYDESFTYEVFDSHGQEDDASQELVKADDAS